MKGKRLTAFITTVAIIVTSFAFAIPAFAVSVKQANQTSGDLTFIVPEAIYLVPNGTSWRHDKCTFPILCKQHLNGRNNHNS